MRLNDEPIGFGTRRDVSNGVPRLSVDGNYDDGANPGQEHVLAVRTLRGGMEPFSTGSQVEAGTAMAVSARDLASELEELIAALDRRVPRVEQAGEADIARDAAALRAKAIERLAEIVNDRPVQGSKDRGDLT